MHKRKAFTLIEIIIVVTIIAILALAVLGNYSGARQQAKIDVVTDTLASVIKEKQSNSKNGKGDKPLCYGLMFKTGGAPYVSEITTAYVSVDPTIDATKADFCDMRQSSIAQKPFELMENYKIKKINAFGNDIDSYVIMFRPPNGLVSAGKELSIVQSLGVTASPLLKLTVESASGKDRESFSFDVTSGVAQRISEETLTVTP